MTARARRPASTARTARKSMTPAEPHTPWTRSRSKAMAVPRPPSPFPALPPEELTMPPKMKTSASASACATHSPQCQRSSRTPRTRRQVEACSPQHSDAGSYSVESPTLLKRQSLYNPQHSRIVGEHHSMMMDCMMSTPSRMMESPMRGSLRSLSPSPSPSPSMYAVARNAQRRLTFSLEDLAAAKAASGSVAGSGGVSAPATAGTPPATMFTPPATRLVRPDPSAFASTGLQTRKQLIRSRRNTSFISPETPSKRMEVATGALDKTPVNIVSGEAETSGMVTPNSNMMSVVKPTPDVDHFKLGKHRNTSTDSLRRTRKKPHIGPIDPGHGMQSLFDTPCRPRQNTLVEEDDDLHELNMPQRQRPPGFNLLAAAEGSRGASARVNLDQLPSSFDSRQQQQRNHIQTLATNKHIDPSRLSWATGSDVCSESSAATLASSSNSFSKKGKGVRQRLAALVSHGKSISADAGLVFDGAKNIISRGRKGCTRNSTVARGRKPDLQRFSNLSCGSLLGDAMELDAEVYDDSDGDASDKGAVGDDDDISDDDVFGRGNGSGAGRRSDQTTMQSPRIMAVERPQMPQIVQGCATNYAHFLDRDYFCLEDKSLPFLSPKGDFHNDGHGYRDGVGYLEYFAQRFEVITPAGAGNFSTVHTVRSLDDGVLYAIKRTHHPFTGRQERALRLREVDILWSIPETPGIVRLVNAWEQFGFLYMQFELCKQGNLQGYIDRIDHSDDDRFPEARAWAILAHAAHSINHLHANHIAHLDIKPTNFLLGPTFGTVGGDQHEGWIKLADFGHAVRLPHEPLAWVEEGDRQYMAPEVLQGCYTTAADVFSLGMMMLEITTNIVLPENGVEWKKLREGCFDDQVFENLPYSIDLITTIKWMLSPEPEQRPTLSDILEIPQCTFYTSAPVSFLLSDDGDEFTRLRSRYHNQPYQRQQFPSLVRASSADAVTYPSVSRMTTRSAAAATAEKTTRASTASTLASTAIASASTGIQSLSTVSRPRVSDRRGMEHKSASAPGSSPPATSTNATHA
ncbi:mitosis inhibitor protein kinase swe1 [Coemansia erecta]|uniref:Mitosis inhibitor protein kinase swe1 n=1 Tax=Coemansia erecta TaxID=147472 RepID=A0A9W8CQB3_9FUNG|nr:mitosis inhibitor protein kinase swe1 [Coemansia erecta]